MQVADRERPIKETRVNPYPVRIAAALAAVSIAVSLTLWLRMSNYRLSEGVARMQSADALVQDVDLRHIAGFRYISPNALQVTDEMGRTYRMILVAACPGLKDAKDFSLVTESYTNMDKFTGIVVGTQLCRFKDFSRTDDVADFFQPAADAAGQD